MKLKGREKSVHGEGDRFVLGLWDEKEGIAGDYVAEWRENGGMLYQSHPDVYKKLRANFPDK